MAIASINPATGITEKAYDAHSDEEVERRIAESQAAFDALRGTDFPTRARWMRAAAQILEDEIEATSAMLTLEMGKTIRQSRAEVLKCAKAMRFYADNAERFLQAETLADPAAVAREERPSSVGSAAGSASSSSAPEGRRPDSSRHVFTAAHATAANGTARIAPTMHSVIAASNASSCSDCSADRSA